MALTLNEENFTFSGRSYNITEEKNNLLEPHDKQIWNFGIVLALHPDAEQAQKLNQQIGNARFVANNYLSNRKEVYDNSKKILSVAEYKKDYLPYLKEQYPFLKNSDKFALEAGIEHIDTAYKNFFENIKNGKTGKKAGFPKYVSRFKPNGNSYTTKFTNDNIELLEVDGLPYVKIPKVGKVRFVMPWKRTLETLVPEGTRILSACIKHQRDSYTISLQMEVVIDKIHSIQTVSLNRIYSIDMGIKDFGIYGNNEFTHIVENPRFIRKNAKRLRRLQQSLSRKVYNSKKHCGSKNYRKAKLKVAEFHNKIKNQRKDFHHKMSRRIVNECDVFICEDLNIKGMLKNHKLAREISSCGWGQFLNFVKYKIEKKGGIFLKVDRFFASSKLCNVCNYKYKDLTLAIREWECPVCHTKHNRDVNAKINILKEGIKLLQSSNIAVVTNTV